MQPSSNEKRKLIRVRKDGPRLSIADWAIEQATTSGHVSLSFVAFRDAADGTRRPVTRSFLLRCEKLAELINELKDALEDSVATERLSEQAEAENKTLIAQPEMASVHAGVDDAESLSTHLDLGAYGLVGN
jgi:hypothetical protein